MHSLYNDKDHDLWTTCALGAARQNFDTSVNAPGLDTIVSSGIHVSISILTNPGDLANKSLRSCISGGVPSKRSTLISLR
uniref:Uncharacterized protein n=1 Tax=Solanum tuberosum TaxID=4113 RepID=M1B0P9_SOLTU